MASFAKSIKKLPWRRFWFVRRAFLGFLFVLYVAIVDNPTRVNQYYVDSVVQLREFTSQFNTSCTDDSDVCTEFDGAATFLARSVVGYPTHNVGACQSPCCAAAKKCYERREELKKAQFSVAPVTTMASTILDDTSFADLLKHKTCRSIIESTTRTNTKFTRNSWILTAGWVVFWTFCTTCLVLRPLWGARGAHLNLKEKRDAVRVLYKRTGKLMMFGQDNTAVGRALESAHAKFVEELESKDAKTLDDMRWKLQGLRVDEHLRLPKNKLLRAVVYGTAWLYSFGCSFACLWIIVASLNVCLHFVMNAYQPFKYAPTHISLKSNVSLKTVPQALSLMAPHLFLLAASLWLLPLWIDSSRHWTYSLWRFHLSEFELLLPRWFRPYAAFVAAFTMIVVPVGIYWKNYFYGGKYDLDAAVSIWLAFSFCHLAAWQVFVMLRDFGPWLRRNLTVVAFVVAGIAILLGMTIPMEKSVHIGLNQMPFFYLLAFIISLLSHKGMTKWRMGTTFVLFGVSCVFFVLMLGTTDLPKDSPISHTTATNAPPVMSSAQEGIVKFSRWFIRKAVAAAEPETEPHQGGHPGGHRHWDNYKQRKVEVDHHHDSHKEAQQPTMPRYPVCELTWGGLDIVDYSLLAELVYYQDADESAEAAEKTAQAKEEAAAQTLPGGGAPTGGPNARNATKGKDFTDRFNDWFRGVDINHKGLYHPPTLDSRASFRHFSTKHLDIIAIRGTSAEFDIAEDISWFSEVALLQAAAWFGLPVAWIPERVASWAINLLSGMDKIFKTTSARHYEGVETYIKLLKKQNPNRRIVLTGHSLGGATAFIAGVKNNHTAVGFSAPGIILSRKKFGIEWPQVKNAREAVDLYTVNVVPSRDIVPMIDSQGGSVHNVRCRDRFLDCHFITNTKMTLMESCWQQTITKEESLMIHPLMRPGRR